MLIYIGQNYSASLIMHVTIVRVACYGIPTDQHNQPATYIMAYRIPEKTPQNVTAVHAQS